MSVGQSYSSECAVGYLQRKGRFYSWKKALFVLCEHGLIQLSVEQHHGHPKSAMPAKIPVPNHQIGDTSDVNFKNIANLKQKQCIALHQLCQMVSQGQREIVITLLDSSTFVLRAQSSDDRECWLAAIRSAVSAAAAAGYAAEYPDHDDAYSVVDEHLDYPNDAPRIPLADATTLKTDTPRIFDLNLSIGSVGLSLAQSNANAQEPSPIAICAVEQDEGSVSVAKDDNPMGWLPSTASLPRFGNKQSTSSLPRENASTNPANHFSASQNNDSHDFGQSIVHIAHNTGSVDVDALFDDGNSEIGGSTSSGELPLAVIASRTAELHRAKQAACSALLKTSNMQLPALKSYIEPPTIADGSSSFNGMFDTLLYTQDISSSEEKHADFNTDISFSRLHLDSSATEMPASPRESTYSRPDAYKEPPIQIPSTIIHPDIPENASDMNSSKYVERAPSTTTQQQPSTLEKEPDTNGSMALLNTSIADFAGSLFDGICLGNLSSTIVDSTTKPPSPQQTSSKTPQAPSYQTPLTLEDAAPNNLLGQASAADLDSPREENSAARLLNSPGRSQLGNHIRVAGRRSVMTIYGGLGVSAQQQKQKHAGPSGIQMSMLAKYSDSLNASRALLSSGLRNNKGTSAYAWGSRADFSGSVHHAERPATIVQYEPKEPKDTGVRKVVRGQFAKELIQKEAERRPAVRRIRQVKSETKVPPLKSIRLRLDGSIVGSTSGKNAGLAAINNSSRDTTGRGLRSMAKEGKTSGVSGQGTGPSAVSKSCVGGSNAAVNANVNESNAQTGGTGAFDGFNAIRERLKAADEKKRLQHQAQMLDNEGVDNVRIGDLMQTRQDTPLAVQLEEKRRMQEAKRLALFSQQLEHQKRQMELQRLNAEQQQQYQEFKRQSLCPPTGGPGALSQHASQAGWAGYDNGAYGGTDSYTNQWVQNQNLHMASSMPSPYAQSMRLQSQGTSRSVSNTGFRPTSYMSAAAAGGGSGAGYMHDFSAGNMAYPDTPAMVYDPVHHPWQHQQQHYFMYGNASGRPVSQYTQTVAPNPRPANSPAEHTPAKNMSTSKKRQPGAAFVKHGRSASAGAKSDCSNGSTESWQSDIGRGAHSSIHANTEPAYEGSVYVISPIPNAADTGANGNLTSTARRAHSYGQAEHRRRLMAKRVSDVLSRPRATDAGSTVPPVPPLPHNLQQGGHHLQAQQHYSQQQHYSPYQMAGGGWNAQNQMFMSNQQRMYAEMQTLSRKRNEMSTDTPSLLQQLDHARVLGVLPNRHQEKAAYTKGAYQNYNVSHLMRDGTSTNMQYLGDGNTLLIDQAYEAEKSRTALLKKISHTYKGIGGETGPAPVF
ncbi:hypothetical protein IW140_002420 [Coemansia sp. RSA 1813]|nr:hypothetical protein LPJ74_000975 [Coemansia sp. RSA 1843]KAJ2215336.1 hypothetical protein EV179_002284 [Coemansia sp. RSA 487]KAJ2570327.1 hypothetical protein IW140_002420 [Coemansia sp. RSA 1813]